MLTIVAVVCDANTTHFPDCRCSPLLAFIDKNVAPGHIVVADDVMQDLHASL